MTVDRNRNIESAPLPHNVELELTILGTSLIESVVLDMAVEKLREDDFYLEKCQDLFKIMRDMISKKIKVDMISLGAQLELLSREDLIPLVADLSDKICAPENAESHLEQMSHMGVMRRLIVASHEIERMCYNYDGDFENVVDKSESIVQNAVIRATKNTECSMQQLLVETFESMEQVHKGIKSGVTTGFKCLDEIMGGFEPGDLTIIAGRPGMGKTALALSMALQQAVCHKIPIALFSLEMPRKQIGQRSLSAWAEVNVFQLRNGLLTKTDLMKVSQIASDIASAPIYTDDQPLLSLQELRSKSRKLISKYGVKLIIVDYLQLMQRDERLDTNSGLEKLTRGLKTTAKDLNVPIIALSQLNRDTGKRGKDHRPRLEDLRGSGAIEQDADNVLFVHREWVYDKEVSINDAEVIVAKQRNGPIDTVKMDYTPACALFKDAQQREEW